MTDSNRYDVEILHLPVSPAHAYAGLEGDDSCILEARRMAAALIGNL